MGANKVLPKCRIKQKSGVCLFNISLNAVQQTCRGNFQIPEVCILLDKSGKVDFFLLTCRKQAAKLNDSCLMTVQINPIVPNRK